MRWRKLSTVVTAAADYNIKSSGSATRSRKTLGTRPGLSSPTYLNWLNGSINYTPTSQRKLTLSYFCGLMRTLGFRRGVMSQTTHSMDCILVFIFRFTVSVRDTQRCSCGTHSSVVEEQGRARSLESRSSGKVQVDELRGLGYS